MIFVFSSWLIYHLIIVISVCNGQRRVIGGHEVTVNHTYMVYLIKAEYSEKTYLGWLCGGALIRKRLAITSAACVRDVHYMYLIAGYNRYISDVKRDENKCIRKMKRRVITIYAPTDYNLDYDQGNVWSSVDIAVIKTDLNVTGVEDYRKHCHYVPGAININFDKRYLQDTGRDVLFLGWGHTQDFRNNEDETDYNTKILRYGSTQVYDKKKCLKVYQNFSMALLITKYLICTWPPSPYSDNIGIEVDHEEPEFHIKNARDGCSDEGEDNKHGSSTTSKNQRNFKKDTVGICQNDHGGPLLSNYGDELPEVIGIASAFKLTNSKCTGPFLFTSTYCCSKFLKCVIRKLMKSDKKKKIARRSMNSTSYYTIPGEKDFKIIERHISWCNHLDGPAENEKCQLQAQRSVQDSRRR